MSALHVYQFMIWCSPADCRHMLQANKEKWNDMYMYVVRIKEAQRKKSTRIQMNFHGAVVFPYW